MKVNKWIITCSIVVCIICIVSLFIFEENTLKSNIAVSLLTGAIISAMTAIIYYLNEWQKMNLCPDLVGVKFWIFVPPLVIFFSGDFAQLLLRHAFSIAKKFDTFADCHNQTSVVVVKHSHASSIPLCFISLVAVRHIRLS